MFCVHVKKRDDAAALFAVTDIHDEKEATDKFRMEPYSYDDLSKGHVIRYGDLFVSSEEATVGDKSQGTPHTLVATTNRDKAKRVFPKQTAQGLTLTDENGHLLTCEGEVSPSRRSTSAVVALWRRTHRASSLRILPPGGRPTGFWRGTSVW